MLSLRINAIIHPLPLILHGAVLNLATDTSLLFAALA